MTNRDELDEMAEKAHEVERQWVSRLEKQTKDFERQIAEKEKWLEAVKLQETSELSKIISDKEKEIACLHEQLSTTYKDMNFEIEVL